MEAAAIHCMGGGFVGTYLERLCIFICLGDLLANFLPSQKFAKLYRYVAGALILLLIVNPLGQEMPEFINIGEGGVGESFRERILKQNELWYTENMDEVSKESEKVLDAYMESFTDEEMKEELERYGYEMEESDDGKVETAVR